MVEVPACKNSARVQRRNGRDDVTSFCAAAPRRYCSARAVPLDMTEALPLSPQVVAEWLPFWKAAGFFFATFILEDVAAIGARTIASFQAR